MRSYNSESTNRPVEWDLTSSPTHVYHNTDIVEVEAHGDIPTMFHYRVVEYTREEYAVAQAEAQSIAQADNDTAMLDHEYRLIILEMGV